MADDIHKWKVLRTSVDGVEIPSVRWADAASPLAAVENTFEKQVFHVVPPPVCDYLGGDIWMIKLGYSTYFAIAPFNHE